MKTARMTRDNRIAISSAVRCNIHENTITSTEFFNLFHVSRTIYYAWLKHFNKYGYPRLATLLYPGQVR